jgi:hypothetical protein
VQALEWTRLFYSKTALGGDIGARAEGGKSSASVGERRQLSRQASKTRSISRASLKGSSKALDKARAAAAATESAMHKHSHIAFWYNKRTGQIGVALSFNGSSAVMPKIKLQGEGRGSVGRGRLYTENNASKSSSNLPSCLSGIINGADPMLPPINEDIDAPIIVLDALHDLAAARMKPLLAPPPSCMSHIALATDETKVGAVSAQSPVFSVRSFLPRIPALHTLHSIPCTPYPALPSTPNTHLCNIKQLHSNKHLNTEQIQRIPCGSDIPEVYQLH